jgi:endonuclease III
MAKAPAASSDLMATCEALEERWGNRKPFLAEDFIEALVWQILELSSPERTAKDALKRIQSEYVDWNDMRVATVREIQDILGPRYPRCREKAEDLSSLLADLYTAFRRMELNEMVATPEGIDTLRALPDTTLIRVDMVETALLTVCKVKTFPCDEDQFRLLKFLGGVPKAWTYQTGVVKIAETLEVEDMLRLSRGLREHWEFIMQNDEYDPQPIDFKWDKKAAAKKAPAKKAAAKKAPAKKAAAKKAAPAKEAPPAEEAEAAAKADEPKAADESTAEEPKKAPAKKAPAKKAAAKKAPAKKAAKKAATTKKAAAKKSTDS